MDGAKAPPRQLHHSARVHVKELKGKPKPLLISWKLGRSINYRLTRPVH
jgi:hypothetical protein